MRKLRAGSAHPGLASGWARAKGGTRPLEHEGSRGSCISTLAGAAIYYNVAPSAGGDGEAGGMRWANARAMVAAGGLLALCSPAAGAEPKVVVTIKPLHALVAQVMGGVGVPELLVKGSASPHTYALRPSETRALQHADLFVRMSETVEPFTARIVKSLPDRVEVVTLQEAPRLKLLSRRAHATFERHNHAKAVNGEHGHSDDPGRSDGIDGHAWLDPDNAIAMVDRIEQA